MNKNLGKVFFREDVLFAKLLDGFRLKLEVENYNSIYRNSFISVRICSIKFVLCRKLKLGFFGSMLHVVYAVYFPLIIFS
jgi:hypothetical protein